MTEPNPNPDAPQNDPVPGEPRQDTSPSEPVEVSAGAQDSPVVPDHSGVQEDDAAEPVDAETQHKVSSDEVENQE